MSSKAELRVFRRLGVDLPVLYRLAANSGARSEPQSGRTRNLSAGGMLLRAPAIPSRAVPGLLAGQGAIEVRFSLDGGAPITLACRLIWLDGPTADDSACGLGLKFLDVDDATRARLQAYIEARLD